MPTVSNFEDLEVWQMARVLSQRIYPLTFVNPIAQDFRYKDQIRGCCGAVMDNIAEGFGRGSRLEFINSLSIAKGEAEELKSQLYRGLDNNYFSKESFESLLKDVGLLVKKLASFIRYLNQSGSKGQKFKDRTRKTLNP